MSVYDKVSCDPNNHTHQVLMSRSVVMQYRILGTTTLSVSVLSYGAAPLGSVYGAIDEEDAIRCVRQTLDAGVNFIDVSPYYGLTKAETVLGKALREVPRENYILATKCGRYGMDIEDCDYSADRVTRSVDESLQRLGVEHLDLIQVHDVEFGNVDHIINETLPALVKLRDAGKVCFVGITGLPVELFVTISDLVAGMNGISIDTILSYCHYELNDTALMDIIPDMESKGVGVINASPLGMGLLTDRGTPDWHPAPEVVKQTCAQAAAHCRKKDASLMKLAIQYAVREPRICTTLVGSAKSANMLRNIAWVDEPIDDQLLAEVQAILEPIYNITWPQGRPENN
jgi:L-galactose dehydrogenase